MNALADLIAQAKTHSRADSDTDLGNRVGVSRQTLNEWRGGAKRITDEHLARLIELADADPGVALRVRAGLAKSVQERWLWSTLARRLGVAAVVALAAILPHQQATAAAGELAGHFMHYAKRLYAALERRAWRWTPAQSVRCAV